MIDKRDKLILRELAKTHYELSQREENQERKSRMTRINDLEPQRPIVWIDEIPWAQMNIEGSLDLKCEGKRAREIERFFRQIRTAWDYFQADMIVEDAFYITKSYNSSDIGVEIKENVLSHEANTYIVSHQYEDQLDSEDKLEALKMPIIKADRERDRENLDFFSELFDGVLDVRLRGHGIYYAPWDEISMLRGVEPVLMDMVLRPDFVHRTIDKFTQIGLSRYEQMEEEGLLDYDIKTIHCTPPYSKDLPAKDYDGKRVRLKDVWFRGMAQMFSSVSPEMHDEFDLQYMRTLMDKCGLSYYGCCEPLDKIISYLKKVPNMRKIGVSPWADVRSSAEQIGGDYVFAHKPNPASVASRFDEDMVRREISEVIELCIENACPYEFVLKDISTVDNNPQNLVDWTRLVMETIDHYYT